MIWALLGTRSGRCTVLIIAGLAIGFGTWKLVEHNIRSDERAQIEAEDAQDYIDTRKDIDNADIGEGDADADLDWLRGAADRLHGSQ